MAWQQKIDTWQAVLKTDRRTARMRANAEHNAKRRHARAAKRFERTGKAFS